MASSLEAAAELDVLHQRNVRIAAHRLEDLAANEDGLIARGDAAPARPQVHEEGDHRQDRPRAVEAHVESPAHHGGVGEGVAHGCEGAIGEPRVGVEEEEDAPVRGAGARVHLGGAAARAHESRHVGHAAGDPSYRPDYCSITKFEHDGSTLRLVGRGDDRATTVL